MSSLAIQHIEHADDPRLEEVSMLFLKLYQYIDQQEKGIMLPLSPNAAILWKEAISTTLNRMGTIAIVIDKNDNKTLGFSYGMLRLTPDYLGSKKVGYITHFYITPEVRKKGAGKRLLGAMENWFVSKQVHSIELQVTYNNTSGHAFWEAMGFKNELIQLRKVLNG